MQNESHNAINKIEDQDQEEFVLFKYKRAYHQQSYDEIKIHTKKIKANHQSIQKAKQNYKKQNFLDREIMLTNLLEKLELNKHQAQKFSTNQNFTQKRKVQQNSERKKEYFLKKIQITNFSNDQHNYTTKNDCNLIQEQMKNIRTYVRRTDRQSKLNEFRHINEKSQINKRIKYKIIDIRQQNIVDFNGQKFEYQDLSQQYNEQEKLNVAFDYYVLRKGQSLKSHNLPSIILPQQAEYLLEDEDNNKMQTQTPQDSEQDSNRQDRSDYQYPEQDYHQNDDQSQGIISGKGSDEEEGSNGSDLRNSYQQEDEQEYYRQYQKRCKRKQQGDEQLVYLYNLKPSKYDDEDSDY